MPTKKKTASGTKLAKISKRAKAIYKARGAKTWQAAMQKAAKEV